MKKVFMTLLTATMATAMMAQYASRPAIPRDAEIEQKVEERLQKMTLDDKVGQMLELNLDVLGTMTVENPTVDRDKLRQVMQQMGRPDSETASLLKLSDKQILAKMGSLPVDIYPDGAKRVWKLNQTMLDTTIAKYRVG